MDEDNKSIPSKENDDKEVNMDNSKEPMKSEVELKETKNEIITKDSCEDKSEADGDAKMEDNGNQAEEKKFSKSEDETPAESKTDEENEVNESSESKDSSSNINDKSSQNKEKTSSQNDEEKSTIEDESDNNISLSTTNEKEYDSESFKKDREDIEGVLTDEIPEPKYKKSDKVYARDHENKLLYLAHIRQSMYGPVKRMLDEDGNEDEERDAWHYFVHFHKWGSRWDTWIKEDDIYPKNEQIADLAASLAKAVRGMKSARKIYDAVNKTEKAFWEERKIKEDEEETRRLHEEHVKQEKKKEAARLKKLKEKSMCAPLPQSLQEKISLSVPLKKVMVDDWEAITQLNLFPTIPAKITVKSVLDQYLNAKLDLISDTSEREEWKKAINELLDYFDKALPLLLYPQETPFSIVKLSPCRIYSCEYLLRLLVKLPALIKEECKSFCLKMSDLVRFLNKNQFAFFQQNYKKRDGDDVVNPASKVEKQVKKRGRKRLKTEQPKITTYLKSIEEE